MRLWDIESGQELRAFIGHEGPIFGAALSPDGTLAASGGADRTVRIWDTTNGELRHELLGHGEPIWSMAFGRYGRYLLSAGSDEVVRLWDLVVGREVGSESDRMARAALPQPRSESEQRGAKLYAKCSVCHTLGPNGGNKRAGPNLHGLFGRRAGTVEGYSYSNALSSSSLIWNEETIDLLFAEGPDEYTPGSKMPLQKMPNPKDRADLISYLKLVTGPEALDSE